MDLINRYEILDYLDKVSELDCLTVGEHNIVTDIMAKVGSLKSQNKSVKGDLISRSLLLEHIKKLECHASNKKYEQGLNDCLQCYFPQIINNQPTACNDGWVPVSERLPETNESVLCWAKSTARGGDVCFVGSCHNGFWFLQSSADTHSFPGQYVIVAWQPIQPYKENEK